MKITQLSLIAALAMNTAFAGGDIAPVASTVQSPTVTVTASADCNTKTTINGKLTGYYITDDSVDLFDGDSSQFGLATTLDVAHKLFENITLNLSAVGYVNALTQPNLMYMEGSKNGAFFNVANITATYADTTFVLGRQLVNTPMVGGFDWLLAPGSFEAYTAVNNSFENITLVGSYLREWRPNNTGDNFINLTDIDDGNNYALAAAYDDKTLNGSVWFYNVDAGAAAGNADKYTQVYADTGYALDIVKLAAQYVHTNYDKSINEDSDLYGIKVAGNIAGYDLMAAYVNVADNTAGFVGRDSVYTSSWNLFGASYIGNQFKVEASSEFNGISATASYAYYENDVKNQEEAKEFDLILGYNYNNCIDTGLVFTNTDNGSGDDATNALEIFANYKF